MELNYKELGDGAPLIILHGLFGALDNWLSVAKELAEDYKVYLLDQRNHGKSPHSEVFDYEAMSDDLKEFIVDKNIKDPVVIGHSMGGKTVMNFAVRFPELYQKIVVVDIGPKKYSAHHQTILKGLNSIDVKNLETRGEADKELTEYVQDFGTRQFLLKNLGRSSDGFEWKFNLKALTEKINNIYVALPERSEVNKPALFIGGGNSDYIKERDHQGIKDIFKQSEIKYIEGVGHWIHAEKPDELIMMIKKFVQGV